MPLTPKPTLSQTLPALRQAMLEHGIDRIRIEYNGYGDSGDLFEITALRQGEALPKNQWPQAAQDQASIVADLIIDEFHAGYQNGDGGGGEIAIDANGLVTMDAYWRDTERSYEDPVTIVAAPIAGAPRSIEECLQANFDVLKRALHEACAEKNLPLHPITMSYMGYGDSGGDQEMEGLDESLMAVRVQGWKSLSRFENGQWTQHIEAAPSTIHDLLWYTADEIIDLYHGGYEIDEGGGGEITFDPSAGSAIWSGYHNTEIEARFKVCAISPDVPERDWPALLDEEGLASEDVHTLTDEQADIKDRLAQSSPSPQ